MYSTHKKNEKIAIIGGNGFIGRNFTHFFSKNEFEVVVLDRHVEDITPSPNVIPKAVDIHHTQELVNSIVDVDYVIWLVHASVPATQDDSLVDDFNLNVLPVIKFLEKAKVILSFKKFIYLSSGGTVYGNVKEFKPITETIAQRPISNYGLSKSIAEKYIEYLTYDAGFESVILRPSNVFGEYQNLGKPQGIIGFAFKAIYDKKPLDLYDDGRMIRDFVYVLDVAEALLKCLYLPLKNGTTDFFNIGSQTGYSIKQIIEKIEYISGNKLKINPKISRKFDCSYNVLNTDKARLALEWEANTEIGEGLAKVWNWINIMDKK